MRKTVKKVISFALGAALFAGTLSLAACGAREPHLQGGPAAEAAVLSNGGFVVQKDNYVYFINGVESYESNNSYGSPVKGALMRIKEEDIDAGEGGKAETVVPSLIASGDYTSGIYIYGDRVYYATPNNVRNTSGVIDKNYLDFKSAKLDGTDVTKHAQVSDNATAFRYVEVGSGKDAKVYILYSESSNLHSYDIAAKKDTVLAQGVGAYVFSSSDKTDPYVYYTMTVTADIDTDAPQAVSDYNQIYRVRADATKAPYEYKYDEDYLKEHGGEEPYLNLGEIVLDGIGSLQMDSVTQFNHNAETAPLTPSGYTYNLQSYANGGLYFTRTQSSVAAKLYYLDLSLLGEGWNSVSGNAAKQAGTADGKLDVVANSTNTSKASTSAMFYHTGEGDTFQHHYLYVANNNIYRADVRKDGSGEIENDAKGSTAGSGNQTGMIVAYDVSSASLIQRDDSDETYHYVYYTTGSGICRAVYNGTDSKNYNPPSLPYGDIDNAPWQPVQILDVTHSSGWYNYEVVDGRVYFADARSFGSETYNYISVIGLCGTDGKLLNNKELEAVNDKYNSIMGSDSEEALLAKLTADSRSDLSNAIRYYFFTGETAQFDANIKEATDDGKAADYLYTAEDSAAFKAFAEGKADPDEDEPLFGANDYKEEGEGGKSYRTYSYFVTKLGKWADEDTESWNEYWHTTGLKVYTPAAVAAEGLAGWEIALIVIAVVLVCAGAGVGLWFYFKKRAARTQEPEEEKMQVDTTDDKSVDVYAQDEGSEPEAPAAESESPTEPAAEAETPVAESEAPAVETPAEAPAPEAAPEAPSEEPAAPSDKDPGKAE